MIASLKQEIENLKAKLSEAQSALERKDWNEQYYILKEAHRISFRIYMMTDTGEA